MNIKLLLRDLKLFDINSYQILPLGLELLSIEKNKTDNIQDFFRRLFLLEGNYIDIVGIIQELNDNYGNFQDKEMFKELLKEAIIAEKLATQDTDVKRDLQDILRIIKELEIFGKWKTSNTKGGMYLINWRKILPLVKFR